MCERIGIETCTTTSIVTPSSVNYNARVSSRKSGLVLSSVDLFREPASSNNASSFFSPRLVIASDLSLSLSSLTRDREVPAKAQERTGIITEQRALFFHVSRRCLPSLHLISLTRRQEVREGLTLRDVVAVLLQTLPEEFHRCCTRVGPRVDPTRAILDPVVLVLFVRLVRDRPRTHDAIDSAMPDRRASAPHHSLTNHVRHGPEQRGSATVPASGRWRRRAGLRPRLRRGPARETTATATSSAHVCFVSCASKKCDEMVKIHSCAKQKS